MARLFLLNKFSGPETVELVVEAHAAGAQGVRAMRKAGAQGKRPQNAKRDLLRTLLRGSSLPSYYWADVPTHGGQVCACAMILPHELFALLIQKAAVSTLTTVHPELDAIRTTVASKLALDPKALVPIGFHGDGVPHQKAKSIEVLNWNFLAEPDADRFWITAIEKGVCCHCFPLCRWTR